MCVAVENAFYCVFLWGENYIRVDCASICYTAKEAGLNQFELVVELKHTQLCAIEFILIYFILLSKNMIESPLISQFVYIKL